MGCEKVTREPTSNVIIRILKMMSYQHKHMMELETRLGNKNGYAVHLQQLLRKQIITTYILWFESCPIKNKQYQWYPVRLWDRWVRQVNIVKALMLIRETADRSHSLLKFIKTDDNFPISKGHKYICSCSCKFTEIWNSAMK